MTAGERRGALLLAVIFAGMVVLIVAMLAVGGDAEPGPGKAPGGVEQVEEDEPGWSCVLDGNRTCGPEAGR